MTIKEIIETLQSVRNQEAEATIEDLTMILALKEQAKNQTGKAKEETESDIINFYI